MTSGSADSSALVGSPGAAAGMSPYATGGGGVVLEHRAVARYMALMLAGRTSPELADRQIVRITCQDADPVDDVVLHAKRAHEGRPSLRLAVAARRSPDLIPSNAKSRKLIKTFVQEVLAHRDPRDVELEHRIALAVAGDHLQAKQLADLAALAEPNFDADRYFQVLHTPKKFDRELVTRLDCLEAMVKAAVLQLTKSEPKDSSVRQLVLALLQRLEVVYLRLESPDESDWGELANILLPVAREGTLDSAVRLRDRLESLAGQWVPRTADFDAALLRRHVHHLISSDVHRRTKAWTQLATLEQLARQRIRSEIAAGDGPGVRLERRDLADRLLTESEVAPGLIVRGQSGVGKSALVVDAFTRQAREQPDQVQVAFLHLEHTPIEPLALHTLLGCSVKEAFDDLSAPHRFLIIDAADLALRDHHSSFRHLVASARDAEVRVIAVTPDPAFEVVRDILHEQLGSAVPDFVVPALDDTQLEDLEQQLPSLARLLASKRSREILRRPVVIDLLMRGNATHPIRSDRDALDQVWKGLVLHSRSPRSSPTARDIVMLKLAERELRGDTGHGLHFTASLDAEALDGLVQDGLLHWDSSPVGPVVPTFAHDEIKRYAVARVLLADRSQPAQVLLAYGAPRWAMSAARLACQALLEAPQRRPVALSQLQDDFDAVAAAGHGRRWADVPSEALLAGGDPSGPLASGWAALRVDGWSGVHRLCRLAEQYRANGVFTDTFSIEPIVAQLVQEDRPWLISDDIEEFLRSWLTTLVLHGEPEGHPLRQQLQRQLVAYCAPAEQQIRSWQAAEPDPEGRTSRLANTFAPRTRSGQRIRRPRVPRELTDKKTIRLLVLLAADLGSRGADLLRMLAQTAPHYLAPAVEAPGAARAVADYSYELLSQLTEAYYIDETPSGQRYHDDGIRRHEAVFGQPLAALYYGPFLVLLQRDFRAGVITVNRLLNHAVRCRINPEILPDGIEASSLPDDLVDQIGLRLGLLPSGPSTLLGDEEVWRWYRGSGQVPNPCLSALFAVEWACHAHVAAGTLLATIVEAVLVECENLAMPGLLLDVLTRHIEKAGDLLDPFLADPDIWQADLHRRAAQDLFTIKSTFEGPNPERKTWTLTDSAMFLTLHADADRADRLRAVREQAISKVGRQIEQARHAVGNDWTAEHQHEADQYAALVDIRTGALERERYTFEQIGNGIQISAVPDPEVEAVVQPGRADVARINQLLKIHNRYFVAPSLRPEELVPFTAQELVEDIESVHAFLDDPPQNNAIEPWDVASATAATALHEHLVRQLPLPATTTTAAIQILLAAVEGARPPMRWDGLDQFGLWLADRSAARGLPLLLLPHAASLLSQVEGSDRASQRIQTGCMHLASTSPLEARLLMAQALDPVWETRCDPEGCHHASAYELVKAMVSGCLLGPADSAMSRRTRLPLNGSVSSLLRQSEPEDIDPGHLDPAIRACVFAATSSACIREEAREFLDALLDALQRTLRYEPDYDHHGSFALGAARAVLRLAHAGDSQPLHRHLALFADDDELLDNTLRGLAAVAEESDWACTTARRIWPDIITQIAGIRRLHEPGHPSSIGYSPLASVLPHRTVENEFPRREITQPLLEWRDLLGWRTAIEQWQVPAAGHPQCVNALIGLLRSVEPRHQVELGLPWVAEMVFARPTAMVPYAFALPDWLVSIRAVAEDLDSGDVWQRIVDELVVAGCRELTGYAD